MATYVCDKALEDRLKDLRRGLHTAMTEIITNKNYREAEVVLRQMDQHLNATLAELHILGNIQLVERG